MTALRQSEVDRDLLEIRARLGVGAGEPNGNGAGPSAPDPAPIAHEDLRGEDEALEALVDEVATEDIDHAPAAEDLPLDDMLEADPGPTIDRPSEINFVVPSNGDSVTATRARVPLDLDPQAAPEPPDYLADGRLERQTVTVTTGDTGAAKSFVTQSLIVAVAERRHKWLERALHPGEGSVLVIDEENPDRLVRARLRALGLSRDGAKRLRYFNREGIRLGDGGESDAWLRAELTREPADLIVVDTATAAIDVDHNDNRAVAGVYRDLLRPIAVDFDLAVDLLLHERKPSNQGPKGPQTMATLGARSWIGQADVQLMLARIGEATESIGPDGTIALATRFSLKPGKLRDGGLAQRQTVTVASKMRPDRALLRAEVLVEEVAEAVPTTVEQVEELLGIEPAMLLETLESRTGKADKTVREALKKLGAVGTGNPKRWSLPTQEGLEI